MTTDQTLISDLAEILFMRKRRLVILRYTFLSLIVLIAGFMFSLQTTTMQTWIAKLLTKYAGSKWGTEISIDQVSVDLWARLNVKGLYVEDQQQDTLLYIPELLVNEYTANTDSSEFTLGTVELYRPYFNLYYLEQDSIMNLDFLLDAWSSDDTAASHYHLSMAKLLLHDARFALHDRNEPVLDQHSMDWSHLNFGNIQADFGGIELTEKGFKADCNHLYIAESSGFNLEEFKCGMRIQDGHTQLTDTELQFGKSQLIGDLDFGFNTIDELIDFNQSVDLSLHIDTTTLFMDDLAWFAEDMHGWERTFDFSGDVQGRVNSLHLNNASCATGKSTVFQGDVYLEGLPEIDQTFMEINIKQLVTSKSELDGFELPPYNTQPQAHLETPNNFADLGTIAFNGNFTGFLHEFVVYGDLKTDIGTAKADITLMEINEGNDYAYSGDLSLFDFDLGKFYHNDVLGPLSCAMNMNGHGLTLNTIDVEISGVINRIYIQGYDYKDISADGQFKHHAFDGIFEMNDPNASMRFKGSADFTQTLPELGFEADIYHLNLQALQILPDFDYSAISGYVRVQSEGLDFDRFSGSILLSDISYCAADQDYYLNHFELTATQGTEPSMHLTSDILNAQLQGDFSFSELGSSMLEIASKIIPSLDPPIRAHTDQAFNIEVRVNDFNQISGVFLPGLSIAPGTFMKMEIDESISQLDFLLASDSITFQEESIYGLALSANQPDESFYITASADDLDLSAFDLSQVSIDTRTLDDTIYTSFAWQNPKEKHFGDIAGKLIVENYQDMQFEFFPSTLGALNKSWFISKNAKIGYDGGEIFVNNFHIAHNEQRITVDGMISENPEAELIIQTDQFNLDNLNFMMEDSLTLRGLVFGEATLRNLLDAPILTGDLKVTGLGLNEYDIGEIEAHTAWDPRRERLRLDGSVKQVALLKGTKNETIPLTFAGYYTPSAEEQLDLTATLQHMDLSVVNTFMPKETMDIHGYATGTLAITGRTDAPELRSTMALQDGSLYVHYLNTTYFIHDKIKIAPDMVSFDNILFTDEENHKGRLTGQLLHDNFSNWNFDIVADMQEPMLTMNTNESMNDMYFGKAYATGAINISGNDDNMDFDIQVKTEKGTNIALPMGNSTEDTFESFIHFVNPNDSASKRTHMDFSGINMTFGIDVTPDAQFQVIFDKSIGDIITGRGAGHLDMKIDELSNFTMAGEVEVKSGTYLFTLKNLISKNLVLKPGGTIEWLSDPFDAQLNLTAVYDVAVSLYDLLPEPQYQTGPKVNTKLDMNLKGQLFSPAIDFKIDLPTVDQVTKSRVNAAISSEQEKNRQAFALLVLRRFVSPPNVSVDHNSSNAIAANGMEFVSSQISNWLSQISDDVNLGFNYNPGDDISNEEIKLILSTQLFNERLSISSNLGVSRNNNNANSQNTNNLIGDIRIEYKVTKEGRVRVVMYNESNDYRVASTQQSPYTQGLGVIYREEFDNLNEFIHNLGEMLRRHKKKTASNP